MRSALTQGGNKGFRPPQLLQMEERFFLKAVCFVVEECTSKGDYGSFEKLFFPTLSTVIESTSDFCDFTYRVNL